MNHLPLSLRYLTSIQLCCGQSGSLVKDASGMFDVLRAWAKSQSASLIAHGIHMEITMGGASVNPGMRLDFDGPRCGGRITCWESGECELEVIDVDTEKTIYSEHQTLTCGF